MAKSLEQFARELRAFDGRREVLKEVRKGVREPVPALRKSIRDSAINKMPKGGGLNKWLAKVKLSAKVQVKGSEISIKLRAGRNSMGGRSDVKAIDRGRVRAPSWGRRGKGQWHNQSVEPGFFTDPVTKSVEQFRSAAEAAVDTATRKIRGG